MSVGREPITHHVVEDHASVARAFARHRRSVACLSEVYASVDEFMARSAFADHRCAIADVQMCGANGVPLQRHLKKHGGCMPVILLTAQNSPDFTQ